MRSASLLMLLGLLLAAPLVRASEGARRVATISLEPGPYLVTLPENVGVLRAGEARALAFEVSGRLESALGEAPPCW